MKTPLIPSSPCLNMITDPENPDEQPQQYDEPIIAASPEESEPIQFGSNVVEGR